jgi:hypothetical protein
MAGRRPIDAARGGPSPWKSTAERCAWLANI